MRILHTSDWHLGHTLRGEVSREREHAAFLTWLVETCVAEAPDALLITGDVFDSATPPAAAETMWFEVLARLRRRCPALDIIAIAGNHDSPARLGAASSILRELGVHVIAGLPRDGDGGIDVDRVLIPIAGGRGLVAAVPFLRPVDLPLDVEDPLTAVYAEISAAAKARRRDGQALIVTGHLYVAGADASYLSERRVSVGGLESAPLRLFPRAASYVALGHVHRAQRVVRDTIRYAGAPIALSLDEAHYPHQVVAVDLDGERVTEIRPIAIPQTVDIVRVPSRGGLGLAQALAALEALPARTDGAEDVRPYLEVVIQLERPEPKLRSLVEAALEGKHPRLVRLHVERTGDGAALADRVEARRLAELDPRVVFERLWARDHAIAPEPEILTAFDELLAEVRGDRSDPSAERSARS